jgi:hypothetical protein
VDDLERRRLPHERLEIEVEVGRAGPDRDREQRRHALMNLNTTDREGVFAGREGEIEH